MAGRKKVIPRHQNVTETRHEQKVEPRWSVLAEEESGSVKLKLGDFYDEKTVSWNKDKLFQAKKAYPGKTIEFAENENANVVYRNRAKFFKPDGRELLPGAISSLEKFRSEGHLSRFYDMPLKDPSDGNWIRQESIMARAKAEEAKAAAAKVDKPKTAELPKKGVPKISDHPKFEHVKIVQDRDPAGRDVGSSYMITNPKGNKKGGTILKTENEARRYNSNRVASDINSKFNGKRPPTGAERTSLLRRLNQVRHYTSNDVRSVIKDVLKAYAPKQSIKRTKRRSPRMMHGEVWDKKTPLAPYQHLSRSGVVYNVTKARMKQIRQTRVRRELAEQKATLQRNMKKLGLYHRHQRVVRNDKQHRNQKARIRRAKVSALKLSKTVKQIRAVARGRVPLKMKLQGKEWATGRTFGKAMRSISREKMYPTMNHSAARRVSPALAKLSAGRLRLSMPFEGTSIKQVLPGRTLTNYAKVSTLTTPKFPDGGRGIIMAFDVEEVISNLTTRYPAAMKAAAQQHSKIAGKQLLDIVEPYVPKDKGLLYSTASTDAEQMGGSLVDIDGASPYPASDTYGVSISYNAPYAELVYFDESVAHGAAYNAKHGTSEKGEQETAHWIEVAFAKERSAVMGVVVNYAQMILKSLDSIGYKSVSFKGRGGKPISFLARK